MPPPNVGPLTGGNAPETDEAEQSIPNRFEKIVRNYPDRLAVKMGDRSLTYDELNQLANRIAHAILARRGPGSEPIALLFEHGIDVIAAIFGVLKTGKFYIAIDPSFPRERIAYLCEDSQASLIVTNERNFALANQRVVGGGKAINIDAIANSTRLENLEPSPSPDDIATITYTSGSTGTPKGVTATHKSRLSWPHNFIDLIGICPEDRFSLVHSVTFASAAINLFSALLNGASLWPFNLKTESIGQFAEWLQTNHPTVLHLPPVFFRELSEIIDDPCKFAQIRVIRLSGAPITRYEYELFKNKWPRQTSMAIGMGSTETGTITQAMIGETFHFPVHGTPLGYPAPDKTIVLVDENGEEVGAGEIGELVVKGTFLQAGYWNPSTANHDSALHGSRAAAGTVRTGDLVRMRADGFLIHLGRKDFMVKIRGYRVHLSEVERALAEYPGVKDAAVAAWDRKDGEKNLVGYIVMRDKRAPTVDKLRGFLKEKLPDYMIPLAFVFLESLPLTNGKLDRKALPKLENGRPQTSTPYALPRSHTEQKLVEMWEKVLEVHPVGLCDDFFELGGHSLLAARLLAEIEKTLGISIPLSALLQAPTVEQLAAFLIQKIEVIGSSLIPVLTHGSRPPFFCVHGADSYTHFRRHLGTEQPFYGLAQHLSGRQVRYTRIPDIAAHYIQEMRRVQPEGPYFFGGHSIGGTIAFEMAQQLKKQGVDVAFLAMLDSGPPRTHSSSPITLRVRDPLSRYWRKLYQAVNRRSTGCLFEQIKSGIAFEIKSLACRMHHFFRVVLPPALRAFYIDQVVYGVLYAKAMKQYWLSVYAGPVVYFKSELDTRESVAGWQKMVAGPFEVHRVHGDHLTMLQEPNVGHLIEMLEDCLSKAQSNSGSQFLIDGGKTEVAGWIHSKNRFLERTGFGKFLNEGTK